MAQFHSFPMYESFSFRHFSINSLIFGDGTYDFHALDTKPATLDSSDLDGLSGTYSYARAAMFWNGAPTVQGADEFLMFGGTGLVVDANGVPTAGTLTSLAHIDSYLGAAYITNFSISAVSFYNASKTLTDSDDLAILRAMLAGNDRISLSGAGDYAFGHTGNDKIYGYAGSDTLNGDSGNDLISGGGDDDRLVGGTGQDSLFGGQGNDVLTGGAGRDILDGGADHLRDIFIFKTINDSAKGNERDVTSHFGLGEDDLNVTTIDSNTKIANDQDFTFNGSSAKANAVWYSVTTGGITIKGDVNGDKISDFEIKVEGIASISASDFIL